MTGALASDPPDGWLPLALLFWPAAAQPLVCPLRPRVFAFTPHTFRLGFPALTGALAAEPPWPPDMFVLPLLCVPDAQVLVWPLQPAALALIPQTLALGLPALIGALTDVPLACEVVPLPPVLPLPCDVGAQALLWLLRPSAPAFTPHTLAFPFPAFTGAETVDLPVPPVELLLVPLEAAQLLVWPLWPPMLALTPHTLAFGLPAFTGAETADLWPPPVVLLPLPCVLGAQPLV